MYAIKGAWVGRAFALASSNDSGGKKSRIRRSKEERKTMVESFIKKYQKLNNGNFPSLNLTHKEVGGSFYTVREIVREIIQENRVLGPAKFSMEGQENYMPLEQFPLGSIAIEPQTCLSPSEERDVASAVTLNQYNTEIQEDILSSSGQPNGSEHQSLLLDNEQVANGSNVVIEEVFDSEGSVGTQAISDDHQVTNDEQLLRTIKPFNKPNHQEVNNEKSDAPVLGSAMPIFQHEVSLEHHQESNKEQLLHSGREYAGNRYLISSDDEVVDEISQALGETNECGDSNDRREVADDNLDSAVVQISDLEVSYGKTGLKADVNVEKFPLRPVARTIHDFEVAVNDQCDRPKTSEAVGTDCDSTSSSNSMDVVDVAVPSVGDSPTEGLKLSTTKETLEAQTSHLVGKKPVNDTERVRNEKKINTRNSGVDCGQQLLIHEESSASKSQTRNQHDSSKKRGMGSTLNRPNLEMWEGGSSVKPAERESNPLLALLKEFIKAFQKFLTE